LPDRPIKQKARDLWERVRLTVRSGTIWALAAAAMFATGQYTEGGILTFVSLVFFLFPPQIHELQPHLEHDFGTDSGEFLSTIAGATGVPIVSGNRVAILNGGEEFYPAMLDAIAKAEFSITMEQYIFSGSQIGREFAEAFAERARHGVSVKLLLDAVGSASLGREILNILNESGCEVRWFHPLRWYNLHRVNNRTHRKSVVIDGSIAFTGGAGIGDHWCSDQHQAGWRDLQIRVEGPGVIPIQTGFAFNWLYATGELIAGPRYYPVLSTKGGIEVQSVVSSPKNDAYTASILYSLTILCARRSVYIANPYFVPGPRTIEMLHDAVRRGVEVKVMVAGPHNDTWWARQNSVRLYGKLLEAGVQILEYQPTMLHQKTMIVDGIWATVGTTNFDHRSLRFNEECNVCFYDPELLDELNAVFEADLVNCRNVTLAEWRKRGLVQRIGERIASLLQDQV
jgi:cardiolipin synthase